jgi:hypothetical protein
MEVRADEGYIQATFGWGDGQGWREGARAPRAEAGPGPQAIPREELAALYSRILAWAAAVEVAALRFLEARVENPPLEAGRATWLVT